MALFGKSKQDPTPDLLNADVVHELEAASRKKFTGMLEVTDVATKQVASLYLFEGGLYAVSLPGYVPSVPDRLRVSGTISTDQAKLLTVPGSDWPSPLAGPVAVEQTWLTAESLASLHQEYLIASLGAVAGLAKVKVKGRKGESTKDFCTLPVPVDPLFDTLRMRAGRLAAGWAAITAEGTPATVALESRHVAPPADMSLPEFTALVASVDGHSSLDAVAYALGLTRAEAVHLTMLLVRAGVLHVAPQPASPERVDRLLVPEAYGVIVPRESAAETAVFETAVVETAVVETAVVETAVVETAVVETGAVEAPADSIDEPAPAAGSPLLATSAVFVTARALSGAESAAVPPTKVEADSVATMAAPVGDVGADGFGFEDSDTDADDDTAPGWAAALLAAEAVAHAQDDRPAQEEGTVHDDGPRLVPDVVPAVEVVSGASPVELDEVQPWAAPTPSGYVPMPEPEPPSSIGGVAAAGIGRRAPDKHVLMLRRELATSEVAELQQLLAKVTAEETDAITRASTVRARLNSALEAVSRIDTDLTGDEGLGGGDAPGGAPS